MFKSILSLLAASTSFVALLLITNSAIATTLNHYTMSQAKSSSISLNIVSPVLELVSSQQNNHLDSSNCCCDTCVQNIIALDNRVDSQVSSNY